MERIRELTVHKYPGHIHIRLIILLPGLEVEAGATSIWPRQPRKSDIEIACLGPQLQFPDVSLTGFYQGPDLQPLRRAIYEKIVQAIGDEVINDIED